MADKKELYWLADGCIFHEGKPLDRDKPIPVDKVGEDFVKRNIDLGNIGEKMGTAEIVTESAAKEIKMLKNEISKAKKDLPALKEALAKLQAEYDELKKGKK